MRDQILILVRRHVRHIVHGNLIATVKYLTKPSVSVQNFNPVSYMSSQDHYNEAEGLIAQERICKSMDYAPSESALILFT